MQCPVLSPALPEPEPSGSTGPRHPGMACVCARLPLPRAMAKCPPESSTTSSLLGLLRGSVPRRARPHLPGARGPDGILAPGGFALLSRGPERPGSRPCDGVWSHRPSVRSFSSGQRAGVLLGCPCSQVGVGVTATLFLVPTAPAPSSRAETPVLPGSGAVHPALGDGPPSLGVHCCTPSSMKGQGGVPQADVRAEVPPSLLRSLPGLWCRCAQAARRSCEGMVGSVSGAHPELAWGWAVWGWEPPAPPVYFVRSQALQVSSAVAGIGCSLKDGGSQVILPCGTWGARYGGAQPVVTFNRAGSRKPRGGRGRSWTGFKLREVGQQLTVRGKGPVRRW